MGTTAMASAAGVLGMAGAVAYADAGDAGMAGAACTESDDCVSPSRRRILGTLADFAGMMGPLRIYQDVSWHIIQYADVTHRGRHVNPFNFGIFGLRWKTIRVLIHIHIILIVVLGRGPCLGGFELLLQLEQLRFKLGILASLLRILGFIWKAQDKRLPSQLR